MKLTRKGGLLVLAAFALLILTVLTRNGHEYNHEKPPDERYVLIKIHDVDDHKVIDELYNEPVQRFLAETGSGHTFSGPGILFNSSNEVEYIELRVALKNPQQNLPRLRRFVSGIATNNRIVIE